MRSKDSYDSSTPSGNSVAIMNLFRLGKMTGETKWIEFSDNTLRSFTNQVKQSPTGFAYMLTGFMFDFKNPKELVITAYGFDKETEKMVQQIRNHYSPNKIVLFKDLSKSEDIEGIIPWVSNHSAINKKTTFYVCEDYTCKRPTTNIKTVLNFLDE